MIRRHNAREKTSLRAYVTAELRRDELFKVLANIAKEHPNKKDPRVTTKQFEKSENNCEVITEKSDSCD